MSLFKLKAALVAGALVLTAAPMAIGAPDTASTGPSTKIDPYVLPIADGVKDAYTIG
jgi:hypothetical protein